MFQRNRLGIAGSICFNVQHVIARPLRLRGGMDGQLAIGAEPLDAAGGVGRGIVDGAVLDACDSARIGRRHFGRNLLGAADCRSERRRFVDGSEIEPLRMAGRGVACGSLRANHKR
jgi:hypothetical protein